MIHSDPGLDSPMMLDVDTGVDDALAIALAIQMGASIVGISSVAGNVPIDLATRNTQRVVSWMKAESIPVHRGASRPLVADYHDAAHVHGENGLGGADLGDGAGPESDAGAVEALLHNASAFDGELVLVALGPLTNVAMAMNLRPGFARHVRRLVIMSGAFGVPGNVTPHAEFNAFADPDACAQVMKAEWNEIVVVGLDVTHQTAITRDQWERLPGDATGAAELVRMVTGRTFTERNMDGFYLHDPLAVAVALHPDLVELAARTVTVSVDAEYRGKTTMRGVGNVHTATAVDSARFAKLFADRMAIPVSQVPPVKSRSE